MHCLAVVDDISCLSPLEEAAYIVEQVSSLAFLNLETVCVVCLRLTAFFGEEVDLIALPSTWEINAQARMVAHIVRSA